MTDLKNPVVFTANRLLDGEAVWLSSSGAWVEDIAAALAIKTKNVLDEQTAIAARADADNHIVEPYTIDVTVVDGKPAPTKFREIIRTQGPTIRADLGKQAGRGVIGVAVAA